MRKNKLSPEMYLLLASLIGGAVFGMGLDNRMMVCAMPGLVLTILAMYNYIRLMNSKRKNGGE